MLRWVCAILVFGACALPGGCAAPPEQPRATSDAASPPAHVPTVEDVHLVDEATDEASTSAPVPVADPPASSAASAEALSEEPPAKPPASPIVRPFEGVLVNTELRRVEIDASVCRPPEPLEQVACSPNSREYESLLSVQLHRRGDDGQPIAIKPSDVHAALLLAGFEAGSPGSWTMENEQIKFVPPTGSELELLVRFERGGQMVTQPIRLWILDENGERTFNARPWVFGGSEFKTNPDWMGPGEHYVADITGSVVGLVTFGDETIGFSEVISDFAALREREWFADLNSMPPEGSPATLIIQPFERTDSQPESSKQ